MIRYRQLGIDLTLSKKGLKVMTIEQLISKALEIERSTNANISGAVIQVVEPLTLQDCEKILLEVAGSDEKKIKRAIRQINQAKKGRPLNNIHSGIETILLGRIARS